MLMGILLLGRPAQSIWPAFYLIGRDGLLYGSAIGEKMHAGEQAPGKWRPRSTSVAGCESAMNRRGLRPSTRGLPAVNASPARSLTFAGLFSIVNPLEAAPSFSL